jgi:hypothetical protein
VVFDFRLGREREGPRRFLGNFEGLLQSDGYGGYDHVIVGQAMAGGLGYFSFQEAGLL